MEKLLIFLRDMAQAIQEIDQEIHTIGHTDPTRKTALLRHRASHIKSMAGVILSLINPLEPNTKATVTAIVTEWANQAQKALDRDSVFLMGTLLIEEGAKEGDPNELIKLIAQLDHS